MALDNSAALNVDRCEECGEPEPICGCTPAGCPCCRRSSGSKYLGALGAFNWYRCRDCGSEFAKRKGN